jgi:hypothetical protein
VKKAIFLLALILFVKTLNAQSCVNNLLQNSGFETGSFTDWQSETGSTVTNGGNAGSAKAASLCNNGFRIYQTQNATAGKTYTFKVFAKNNGTAATGTLAIKYLSASWVPLVSEFAAVSSTAAFSEYSVTKLAPTGTARVEISIIKETGAGCLLVDDACVTEAVGGNPCLPDVTAPVIAGCPASQNLTTSGTSAIATWATPTATDACPGTVTLTSNFNSGSSFPIGSTTVVYTARDAANNSATCGFTVTVSTQPGGGGCTNNLLQNPGFENNLSNWGGSGGVISTTASAGTKSVKLCQSSIISQTVATTTGKNLTLLFKARTEITGTNKILSYIKYLSPSFQPLVTEFLDFNTTATFTEGSISKIAPVGTAFVEIGFLKQTAGCVLLDEVCLSEVSGVPLPDLTITNLVLQSNTVQTGQNLLFNYRASNIGTADGPLPTFISFFLSTNNNPQNGGALQIGGATQFNMTPGSIFDLSGSATIPANTAAGTYYLFVQINQFGQQFEPNSANNTAISDPFSVTSSVGTACGFVKTYFPFDGVATFGSVVPFTLSQSGTNLNSYVFENKLPAAPIVRNVKTDLDGNFVANNVTTFPSGAYLSTNTLLQTPVGDYVHFYMDLGKPIFRKIAANGTVLWTTTISQYNSSPNHFQPTPSSLIADGTGFLGTFSAGNGTVTPQLGEITIFKIDANGVLQWQKTISGLGSSYPLALLHTVTTDGIFATITTSAGQRLYKFDRTNGNVLWSSVPFASGFFGFHTAVLTSDGAVALIWRDASTLEATVQRFNATTGVALSGAVNLANLVGSSNSSFPLGMAATNDGGLIVSGLFGNFAANDPAAPRKYLKLNGAMNLVWVKDFPSRWIFAPKQITSDGGILFVGTRENDYGILKTTAAGDLTPVCTNSCYISSAQISNVICNNNGTDLNPLDDTFTFSANIASSGCSGSWTGAGTTGTFGTAKTINGGLIDGGEKLVSFTEANNPNSTVFSIKIVPPAFCSSASTGCGYETTSASFNPGFQVFSSTSNTIEASQTSISGFPNRTTTFRSVNLDAAGVIGTTVNHAITLPNQIPVQHTPDGNFIYSDSWASGNISLKKVTPANTPVWTKNVAFAVPSVNLVPGSVVISVASISATAIYLQASYEIQPVPTQAPVRYTSLIKTDLDGVKISETSLPSWPLSDFQSFTLRIVAGDGSYYVERYKVGIGWSLFKVNLSGTLLWDITLLGDPPSSSLKGIELSPNGLAVYVTIYSNLRSEITKLNAATGVADWTKNLSTTFSAFSPDGSFENVFVRNSKLTTDGGIIVAFNYNDYFSSPPFQNSGYVYGKLSPNGQLIWAKKDVNIGDLYPVVGTADGGFIFAGTKTTGANWTFQKFNSIGEPTPTCGNTGALPDLNLANLNLGSSSAAVGSVFNYNFDLKNIGTAAASGNFTIKSYLSTDNVLSANDIQDGTIPTGNLGAGQTVPQTPGAMTIPASTVAGNYYVILKVDADNQISESNENNNILASTSPISVTSGGGGNGADLQITITADKTQVAQWNNVAYTIVAKNNGNTNISSATIKVGGCNTTGFQIFNNAFGLVYAGAPGQPSIGNFNSITQDWNISNLAAGQSSTFNLTLFSTGTAERKVVAYASAQSPTDPDSQPSSTLSNCTPTQDDEAVWTINVGQTLLATGIRQEIKPLDATQIADFQLFPNPAGEILNLDLTQWIGKTGKLIFINQLGKVVFEKTFENIQTPIETMDLSGFNNGQYFVKMEMAGQRTQVKRLVVSRMY